MYEPLLRPLSPPRVPREVCLASFFFTRRFANRGRQRDSLSKIVTIAEGFTRNRQSCHSCIEILDQPSFPSFHKQRVKSTPWGILGWCTLRLIYRKTVKGRDTLRKRNNLSRSGEASVLATESSVHDCNIFNCSFIHIIIYTIPFLLNFLYWFFLYLFISLSRYYSYNYSYYYYFYYYFSVQI